MATEKEQRVLELVRVGVRGIGVDNYFTRLEKQEDIQHTDAAIACAAKIMQDTDDDNEEVMMEDILELFTRDGQGTSLPAMAYRLLSQYFGSLGGEFHDLVNEPKSAHGVLYAYLMRLEHMLATHAAMRETATSKEEE